MTPANAGFSMIEILISVAIFSAVILGLAGLAFQVARRSTRATDQTLIMAKLQDKVGLVSTVAYDSLSLVAGCDTTVSGTVRVIACITVTPSSARASDVRVVVGTTVPGGRPDTILLTRGKPRRPIPLK